MNSNANRLIRDVKSIILKHANPERIYLYGSYANGQAGQGSDIDIAYDDKEFKDHYLIADETEKLRTLVKIDVHNIANSEKPDGHIYDHGIHNDCGYRSPVGNAGL